MKAGYRPASAPLGRHAFMGSRPRKETGVRRIAKIKEGRDAGVRAAVQGNTEFALALYRKLSSAEGNLFFSPYSISTALAMTYAGARGDTEAQMARALCYGRDQDRLHAAFARLEARLRDVASEGRIQLRVANSLWPQVGLALQRAFLSLTERSYGVQITPVDFRSPEAARRTINAWVEARTEGKIRDLIPPGALSAATRLVLANAIYFKGDWARPFDSNRTRDEPFWIETTRQVPVPMMHDASKYGYGETPGLQILELPYAGHDLSMVVLLPREPDGLRGLQWRLAAGNLATWTDSCQTIEVQVSLPKFRITCPFRLDDALRSLGMVDAFTGGADFSGMVGQRALHIGAVLHKAFVAVNEEGTEAAGATAVVAALMMAMPEPPKVFRADHPFIFLIRDNRTGSILFMGRVVNPLREAG